MKRLPFSLLVVGLTFTFGAPVIGMIASFFDVVGAFQTLNASGISNPQALGTHIGRGMMSAMLGLFLAVTIGAPLVVASLVLHFSKRESRNPAPAQ